MACLIISSLLILGIASSAAANQFVPALGSTFITYFGGSNFEDATKVAFDNEGNTILIGQTQSDNLNTTDNAFQPDEGGGDLPGPGRDRPAWAYSLAWPRAGLRDLSMALR